MGTALMTLVMKRRLDCTERAYRKPTSGKHQSGNKQEIDNTTDWIGVT